MGSFISALASMFLTGYEQRMRRAKLSGEHPVADFTSFVLPPASFMFTNSRGAVTVNAGEAVNKLRPFKRKWLFRLKIRGGVTPVE